LSLLVVCGFQGESGDEKADEKRTCVACKDSCWWEVEDKKAEQGSDEQQCKSSDKDLATEISGGEEDGGGDDGDACGGAVHVIEEIENVYNQDNPDDGKRGGDDFAFDKEFDADVGEDGGDCSDDELCGEFEERAEVFFVVP
jgi:general stress protein YciG